jgi:hypothetical protein
LFGCSLQIRHGSDRISTHTNSGRLCDEEKHDDGAADRDEGAASAWSLLSADFTRDFVAQCQGNSLVRWRIMF